MLQTLHAIVRKGKIELLEEVPLAEGSHVLITVFEPDDERQFWLGASETAVDQVWGNSEDDIYAELLEG
jgi:hypothetical protein